MYERRTFIKGSLLALLAASGSTWWLTTRLNESSAASGAAGLFPDEALTRLTDLGDQYLQQNPAETDLTKLCHALFPEFPAQQPFRIESLGEESFRLAFQERVREDLSEDRMVRLSGWMLAVSEGRISGLARLLLA